MTKKQLGPLGDKGDADTAARRVAEVLSDALMTWPDQQWVTPHTRALYEPTTRLSQWCLMCLRAYDPDESRLGGAEQIWCSESCRWRGASTRRASLPTEWRCCVVCQTPFLCLSTGSPRIPSGKILCPPAWPAGYWDESPCKAARRRQVNRENQAARRRRAALTDADGVSMMAFRLIMIERLTIGDAADALGLESLAAGGLAAQCARWISHLAACPKPRSCSIEWAVPAHKHVAKLRRLQRALELPMAERVAWLDGRAPWNPINGTAGPIDSQLSSPTPLIALPTTSTAFTLDDR